MTSLSDARNAPITYHKDRGSEIRAEFAGLSEGLLDLIEGAAGCSPYICSLLERQKEWLKEVAETDLNDVLDASLDDIDGDNFDALGRSLRIAKQRIALLVALADLGNLWELEMVTGALTRLADRAVQVSLITYWSQNLPEVKFPVVARTILKTVPVWSFWQWARWVLSSSIILRILIL